MKWYHTIFNKAVSNGNRVVLIFGLKDMAKPVVTSHAYSNAPKNVTSQKT